jgi:hypothetical protein
MVFQEIPIRRRANLESASRATLTGPGDHAWDGTLSVSTRGPAVWADLDVAVLVTVAEAVGISMLGS